MILTATSYAENPFDLLTVVGTQQYNKDKPYELQVWKLLDGEPIELLEVYGALTLTKANLLEHDFWAVEYICDYFGPMIQDLKPFRPPCRREPICRADQECIYQKRAENGIFCTYRGEIGNQWAIPSMHFMDNIIQARKNPGILRLLADLFGGNHY